ncbi:MAG: response regulator [Deltaproteobacteria bacterium]|nr:response regulator [Deltaproteobacteria bacterium]
MEQSVLLVSGDEKQCEEICGILESEPYHSVTLHSLEKLEQALQSRTRGVIILDLDNVPVNNQLIRNLKKRHQQFTILGVSSLPFHPDLNEAVSTHIFACLGKPVDGDELLFWLNAASGVTTKNSPG